MFSLALALLLQSAPIAAPPTPPTPSWPTEEADLSIRDFRFVTGETLPALRIHYTTLGAPRRNARGEIDNAVMVLHGTGGTGKQFLSAQFANELYGPGQPLDIARYFIILPDNIGHGASSKPSDGLRARFPAYDYADMVDAQTRLLDHLGVKKLRLLMGTSMGCMHAFVWGETRPERVQAMMPLACQSVEIAGQNRMWRKMAVDALRDDPVKGMRTAANLLILAGLNPVAMQAEAPTREQAEAALATRYQSAVRGRDADDLIFQLESSRTYNPTRHLERMTMPVTWVNSADDFINPPGLGIAEREAKRLPNGRFVLIPQTAETKGHGTHTWAKFWKGELVELLRRSEAR
jgi:homoserine O-acetyltransferase